MTPKLSPDISEALRTANGSHLQAVDPATGRIYFVVDDETHRRAMEALRKQENHDAIARGIADMEAGRMVPAAEAHRRGREELIAKYRS